MTDKEYFALPALSNSGIKRYEDNPWKFWDTSPMNPEACDETVKDTSELRFGKLVHSMVFEDFSIGERYIICPANIDKRKKEGKEKYKEFCNERDESGKMETSLDEMEQSISMRDALLRVPGFEEMIKGAAMEKVLQWKHAGVPCKCKMDCFIESAMTIIEYKTFDPDAFSKRIKTLNQRITASRYHTQAAWYMDGVSRAYNVSLEDVKFIFIYQNKKDHSDIRFGICPSPDRKMLPSVRERIGKNDIIVQEIKQRLENNHWFDIQTIDPQEDIYY